MTRIRAGIIGCGNIGSELAGFIRTDLAGSMDLAGVFDTDKAKEQALRAKTGLSAAFDSWRDLAAACDLVIETASPACVGEIFPVLVEASKDVMVLSPGGLIAHPEYLDQARRKGVRVYVPSGAIAGIDALKAASLTEIRSVTLTTRKPPKGLEGAPYVVERGIDLAGIRQETVLFEGSVTEAVKAFPKNINVSATLSLAGIGPEKTRVRIVTSPAYRTNTHEIEYDGPFGVVTIRCENLPCVRNPRTSFLSILSAKALLRQMVDPVRFGT